MATAVIKDHASQKRRNFISKFLIYFFLIVITACMLLPFLWMLSSSFKLNKDVFGFPIQWIPKNPRWQNYVDIWTQIPLLTFVKNTVKITVVVTLLQLFTSSFAAYAFAKMQFKGKNVLFLGYIATIAVPWQAYMVPQFMMMSSWHLNNTHLAIMCLQAFSAFGVFLMKQFSEGIPTEMLEAARIDGATSRQILFKIKIPMVMPSVTICTFLTLTNSFKLFDQNVALTAGEPANASEMLALNIYNTFYGRSGAQWKGIGQAKAVVFFLIVVVISLIQLHFTRSKEVQQ